MKLITKLTIFTIIIVLLPMLVTYELNRRFSSGEIESQNDTNLQLALDGFQLELDNLKEELFQKAILFSRNPKLRQLIETPDPNRLQQYLLEIQEGFSADLLQVNDRFGVCRARMGEWTTIAPERLPAKIPNTEDKAYFEADQEDQVVYLKSSILIFHQQSMVGYLTIGKRINRELMWRVSQIVHHDVFLFYEHRYLTGTNHPFNLPLDLANLSRPLKLEPMKLNHFTIKGQIYNVRVKPILQNGMLLGFMGTMYPLSHIQKTITHYANTLFWVYCSGLLIGLVGAFLLVKNIKDSLFGMEPKAIANLLSERTALLQSIHEGIIAVDRFAKITLINTEAQKLFGLDDTALNQPLYKFFPKDLPVLAALKERKPLFNQQFRFEKMAVLYNLIPVYQQRKYLGAIATFTDLTELHEIAEELTAVKTYTEALRAQAHEYKNKLHTISGLIQIDCLDEALHLIHQTFSVQQKSLQLIIKAFPNPQISGLLIGKFNRAWELGINMKITLDSGLENLPPHLFIADLACILGNLLENAFEALQGKASDKTVVLKIKQRNNFLHIKVLDNGPGIPPHLRQKIFCKGFTTKSDPTHGMGLFLVQNCLTVLKGNIKIYSEPNRLTLFSVIIPMEEIVDAKDNSRYG